MAMIEQKVEFVFSMLGIKNLYGPLQYTVCLPVGMLCSPGRIQSMGPSLDLLRGEFSRIDLQPQGIVYKNRRKLCRLAVAAHTTGGWRLVGPSGAVLLSCYLGG